MGIYSTCLIVQTYMNYAVHKTFMDTHGFPKPASLDDVAMEAAKIYFSFQEVELEKTTPYKKPVDFKTRNFD